MHTYIYASFVVGFFLSVSSLVFYCFCASLFWAKHSGWKSKTDTCPKTIHGGGKSNGLKQIDFCLIFSFVWQKRSNKTGFICSWIFFSRLPIVAETIFRWKKIVFVKISAHLFVGIGCVAKIIYDFMTWNFVRLLCTNKP